MQILIFKLYVRVYVQLQQRKQQCCLSGPLSINQYFTSLSFFTSFREMFLDDGDFDDVADNKSPRFGGNAGGECGKLGDVY